MNLYDLFAIAGRRSPAKPALRLPAAAPGPGEDPAAAAGIDWSYGELLARAEAVAASLRRRGIGRGDRVACLLGNGPDMVLLHLAMLRLGAVLVPINLAYRQREIGHILTDAAPRLLVAAAPQRQLVDEVPAGDRAGLEAVIGCEDLAGGSSAHPDPPPAPPPPVHPGHPLHPDHPAPPTAAGGAAPGPGAGAGAGDDRVAAGVAGGSGIGAAVAGGSGIGAVPGGDDLAVLLYTSGTTGASKGAMISHNNLLATVTGLLAAWSWRPDDVLLLALPLFHVHGLVVGLDCALAAGATLELRRRFDAAAVADELLGGAATMFFGVPTVYVRLVEELRRRGGAAAGRGLAALRLCCSGSAPLAPETFAAFHELTGHAILERYGMTETGMILSNPYLGPRRPGEVGTPLPGVSVRLVDEAGRDLAPGAEGELLVRGANVCGGYWRAPEKTAASFVQDGEGNRWFRTGDLARQDPETGAYTLLGRRHELIISGGFNIYPREVEETLLGFPGVREAAVVGRPHPEWGEVPVAYLVADPELDPLALLAFCKSQLAGFKVPSEVRRLDALPRNALGKLQKHLLP
ncbi:MAG TPA: AMP-binding protein [Thermoanaerobaculia bacterium]|nr:AMP-binding protein [Thermoanaerobaculia bacterium]